MNKKLLFFIPVIPAAVWFNVPRLRIWLLAKTYVGQEEIPTNAGFAKKAFEKKMIAAGFVATFDWCMLFVRMVLKSALYGKKKDEILQLITAATQGSYQNLLNAKLKYIKYTQKPKPGDIAFYKWLNNPLHGHAEIVNTVNLKDKKYTSISGNSEIKTGVQGVAIRERDLNFSYKNNFCLLGFIRIE